MTVGERAARFHPLLLAVLISGAIVIPFGLMIMRGPHSQFGGLAMVFFMPSLGLLTLLFFDWPYFEASRSAFVLGILLVQTFLCVPIVFWILTSKRRPRAGTILRIISMLCLMSLFAVFFARFDRLQTTAEIETQSASHAAAVSSLRTLNGVLGKYAEMYGGYPAGLEQLGLPLREAAPSSNRAGLLSESLGSERYFTLTYQAGLLENGKHTGYEIHLDPRIPKYSSLEHYFSDQTGLIRFDNKHATAKSLVIREDLHPTVTTK